MDTAVLAEQDLALDPYDDEHAAIRRRRRWRIAATWGALFLAWFLFFRPTFLGGPLGVVLVHGTSMQPTYAGGDLIITYKKASYAAGDIVAFSVPETDRGLVIHRVTGAFDDHVITQGDNLPTADHWKTPYERVEGRAFLRLPGVGLALLWLAKPFVLAGLAGFCAGLFLWLRVDEMDDGDPASEVSLVRWLVEPSIQQLAVLQSGVLVVAVLALIRKA